MIDEGAVLHKNLQEAVSHKQLLSNCLGQELTEKLERDASNTLKDADTLINQLRQTLQVTVLFRVQEYIINNQWVYDVLESIVSNVL